MKPVVLQAKTHLIHRRSVAIRRAQYVCSDFKKTKEECKVAWDQVEELTKAIHKEDEKAEDQKRTEKSLRIYDC